jgi:hypothetical protein
VSILADIILSLRDSLGFGAASKNSEAMMPVTIHHMRKQGSSDPFEKISGSTGITGVADASWILERGRRESEGTILITGRDVEEKRLVVQFCSCQWYYQGDAEKGEMPEISVLNESTR